MKMTPLIQIAEDRHEHLCLKCAREYYCGIIRVRVHLVPAAFMADLVWQLKGDPSFCKLEFYQRLLGSAKKPDECPRPSVFETLKLIILSTKGRQLSLDGTIKTSVKSVMHTHTHSSKSGNYADS